MSSFWFVIFGCGSSLLAVGLLVGAVLAYRHQQRKFEGRHSVKGTVVALEREATLSGPGNIYCPVVEFTAPDGQLVRFVSDFGTRPASHKVGQIVDVMYNPSNPQEAEIPSGLARWLITGILVFMGLIALCLGSFFLIFALLI